jgi:ATP-dependent exoDNAse (exonuclease V) alpha subunit
MVKLAQEGMDKRQPLYATPPKIKLEGEQLNAVRHLLTNYNTVSIVRGAAGVGKTYLMKEAERLINGAGKKLVTVAPSTTASKGVLRSDGFKAATTVAQLLLDKKLQDQLSNQVLWVDEAGLLGTKDMTALLKLVNEKKARLVLGGDTRQHSSVARGDAMRVLNKFGGVRAAEVTQIRRQTHQVFRDAVQFLADGKTKEGFAVLDRAGVIEDMDTENPNAGIVKDYVDAIAAKRKAIVISPTHKEGEQITAEVRQLMKERKMIGRIDLTASRLTSLKMTEAQRSDWPNFRRGQVVQFNQNLKGIKRGSRWEVIDASERGINIRDDKGNTRPLPRKDAKYYDVFERNQIQVAKGDKIRVTKNGYDRNKRALDNGEIYNVVSVTRDGKIRLQNVQSKARYSIEKDFGHIAYAHCITSHASQGKTVDDVFISQPAAAFGATDAKQFYVSVSRGKRCFIYTDDKKGLQKRIEDTRERKSAIELVREKAKSDHLTAITQKVIHEPEITKTKEPNFGGVKVRPVPSKRKEDREYEPGI